MGRRVRMYKVGVGKTRTPVMWCLAIALTAMFVCVFPVSLATASSRLPKLLGDATHYRLTWQVRPASILYTGDGSGVLGGFDGSGARHAAHPGHLTWATWTRTQATGSGAVWLDDCTPSCAEGKFTGHAVRLRAFRSLRGHFTRLTLRYRYHGKRYVDRLGIWHRPGFWAYYIVGG